MKPWLLKEPYPHYRQDMQRIKPAAATMHAIDADHDGEVLLIGRDPAGFADLGVWLRSQGMHVRNISDATVLDRIAEGNEAPPALLFVDVDGAGCLGELIDRLLILRRARPDLPVILASVDFARDDFDLSRISICDASVAWPVTFTRSEIAIAMAEANNRIWQDQCGDESPNIN